MILRKFLNIAVLLTAITQVLFWYNTAEANPLDDLRNLIKSKKYTIRYEVYDSSREANMAKMNQSISGMGIYSNVHQIANAENKLPQYIVVSNENDCYMESTTYNPGMSDMSNTQCFLQKGNKVFEFMRSSFKGQKPRYSDRLSSRGGKIIPRAQNSYDENVRYGNNDLMDAIMALNPELQTAQWASKYKEVASGKTDDGLQYFDFEAVPLKIDNPAVTIEEPAGFDDKPGVNVIRYYFKDNNLTKISFANTFQFQGQQPEIHRRVITILEISAVPNQKYLELPKELKVGE